MLSRAEGTPEVLARARFALARALWEAHEHDAARTLARQARDTFRDMGPGRASERTDAQAWLDAHRR
jgi:hypothetical protein